MQRWKESSDSTQMIDAVRLENFKKLSNLSLRLRSGNVLVGPNNSGKSSVLDAFRLLDACFRNAKTRNPALLDIEEQGFFDGYEIPESVLPFALANITHNYADADAIIEFEHSNKTKAIIPLHPSRATRFYIDTGGKRLMTRSKFAAAFPLSLIIVPTLAPLEADEPYVSDETVQRNAATRLATRNFRNIWLRKSDKEFAEFASNVEAAWKGVGLHKPELVRSYPPTVQMFYSEDRIDREVQWSGFGFQVWLQIHSHLSRGAKDSVAIIDEPDIYFHPDLQRRLLAHLYDRFDQFIVATHSAEIINEAENGDVVSIDSHRRHAKRIGSEEDLAALYKYLGSSANADFARISRAKRVIFVEGKDGKLLRRFAARLRLTSLSDQQHVPIVQLGGFTQWRRATDALWAFRQILELEVDGFSLFDRDFRTDEEVEAFLKEIQGGEIKCSVLGRKEIENYLLQPEALHAAITTRLRERGVTTFPSLDSICDCLREATESLRGYTMS